MEILAEHHRSLPAVLEPGALEARHVRLFTRDWWKGYPPVRAEHLAGCLAAARRNRLPHHADYRTPWEREEDEDVLIGYELDMIRKSAANMRALGFMAVREHGDGGAERDGRVCHRIRAWPGAQDGGSARRTRRGRCHP